MEIGYKYTVATLCNTYNHKRYYQDALRGFLIQKTTFPTVYIIIDDASTDGEQDLLCKWSTDNLDFNEEDACYCKPMHYGRLIYGRYKESLNTFFSILLLSDNHYQSGRMNLMWDYITEWWCNARYNAFCEGDDYWIDPYKLQKQVDILEKHPECTIAFCKVKNVSRKGTELKTAEPNGNYIKTGIVTLNDFLKYQYGKGRWVFQTSCYFFRSSYTMDLYNTDFYKAYPVGDIALVTELLLRGDGYYIDDVCSCYRVQSGGHTSQLKENVKLVVTYQKKVISSLSILDKITNNKYHKYLESQRLQCCFYIDFYRKDYLKMLAPKYWQLLFVISPKVQLVMALKIFCPPLYDFLRNRRLSQ